MSQPYKTYPVTLAAREQVSPSFVRITLAGPTLADCSPTLLDQRVKLLFGDDDMLDVMQDSGDDWYAALLAAGDRRPTLRTYTLIAVRPGDGGAGEVDIDVAVHPLDEGDVAPGMRFAVEAPIGARSVMVAGDRTVEGHDLVGVAWRTAVNDEVLLVGDETALPAVLNIVSTLPERATGSVVLEVPHTDDVREVALPAGVSISWRVRERGERAEGVFESFMAKASADEGLDAPRVDEGPATGGETEAAEEILWDEAELTAGRQAWIAGEAGWVRRLRAEAKAAGVPKDEVSFMGYWKQGVNGS